VLSPDREGEAGNPTGELLTALWDKNGKQGVEKVIQVLKNAGKTELAKKIKEAISRAQVLVES